MTLGEFLNELPVKVRHDISEEILSDDEQIQALKYIEEFCALGSTASKKTFAKEETSAETTPAPKSGERALVEALNELAAKVRRNIFLRKHFLNTKKRYK